MFKGAEAVDLSPSNSDLFGLCPTNIMLAPMVGITHFAVRQALAEVLPVHLRSQTLWPTEMLSSNRLPLEKEGHNPETLFLDRDHGLCPQLLGNDEVKIQKSLRKLEVWGAKAIDINMGCPVQRALRHNYGVALMGDAAYASQVTAFAVESTTLPVSVKLRAGLQNDRKILLEFCQGIEAAGAAWITLHPRTAEQKRRGYADWSQIEFIKSHLKIPVIGNGDIQTFADVLKMQSETGCDRVMIGRALLGKPWMLIESVLHSNEGLSFADRATLQTLIPQSPADQSRAYGEFLLRTLILSRRHYEDDVALRKLGFLLFHGSVWMEFGHFLFSKVRGVKTGDKGEDLLREFFKIPQTIFERTERRH